MLANLENFSAKTKAAVKLILADLDNAEKKISELEDEKNNLKPRVEIISQLQKNLAQSRPNFHRNSDKFLFRKSIEENRISATCERKK